MTRVVLRLSRSRVTLKKRPNLYGHSALTESSIPSEDSPKSSLTLELEPSLVDLPRNSQRAVRARPCWGSFDVAAWFGLAGPKSYAGLDLNG